MLYPTYKITKKIRTIELFAGYGSTKLAWNYLGIDVKSYKICEWAVKSIQAYKDIHFTDDNTDYSKDLSVEEIKQYLFNKGISINYNEPMTQQQVNRLNEKQTRTIYNNIKATHNLVNIQQVKGKDLEIVDKDKYEYVLSYSFPCQDLSLSGKGKGMSDTSTRSGMLWEVERILTECEEKPQILIMENVPMVHSSDNVEDFNRWQFRLEELGYKNYWQDLIATDYGIPQTRNRTFMVSILGDYNYTFPKPIPLKLKLKDMLEDNVNDKYFISDELMEHIQKTKEEHKEYTQYDRYNGEFEQLSRVYKEKSPTLHTKSNEIKIYVKNATKKEGIVNSDLRIRKLTPRECFRLMGVKDEDFDKVAKNQSDSSLYHLAGDSIVVDVLCHLYKQLI